MGNADFIKEAKKLVKFYNNNYIEDNAKLEIDDIYIVWICKTLQNNKALLSTPIEDGRYYEVTYNGDKQEFYVDTYKKENNMCIKCE